MQITNLTATEYDLPGLRIPASGSASLLNARYEADEYLRATINTLVANSKISVTGGPLGFPLLTALEQEIASGEVPGGGAGNGGEMPANWATFSLAVPTTSPLTVDDTLFYYFAASEIAISEQSGSDFSVGTYVVPGGSGAHASTGAIFSASGGLFQMGMALAVPNGGFLDGGFAGQRYLQCGAQVGNNDAHPDLASLGYDIMVPVFNHNDGWPSLGLAASVPGVAVPGGPAAWGMYVGPVNISGTDSISLDGTFGFPTCAVWQIG